MVTVYVGGNNWVGGNILLVVIYMSGLISVSRYTFGYAVAR